MKKLYIALLILLVGVFSYSVQAQLLRPGSGGLLGPGFFTSSGNTIYFSNSAYVFGDSTNPIGNGQFTSLTVGTLTISSAASGNLHVSGDLFVNGGDMNLGTGLATSTLTATASGLFVSTSTTITAGGLLFPNGTAALPSIAFTNSTSTGFFRAAADTLGWTTGGIERMSLNPSGLVGIGTSTPGAKFSIAGSGGATDNLLFSGINTIYASSSTSTLATAVNAWNIGSSLLSFDTSNSRIGSGTSTPGGLLSISGGTAYPAFLLNQTSTGDLLTLQDSGATVFRVTDGAVASLLNSTGLGIGTSSPNNELTIYSATTPALEFSSAAGPTNKWTMGIDTADAHKFKISSSTALGTNDRLTIDGAGNVGIGTAAPAGNLEVRAVTASADGILRLTHSTNDSATSAFDLQWQGGSALIGGIRFSNPSANVTNIEFSNWNGSARTVRMGIYGTDGNVGIGTTSPGGLLSVSGGTAYPAFLLNQTSTGDLLTLQDSGSTVFRVADGGNVVVGTSTPTSNMADVNKFIVIGNATVPGYLLQSTASSQESRFASGGDGLFLDVAGHATVSNNRIVFRTGETASNYTLTQQLLIDSNGLTLPDDNIIGLGSAAGRIAFDDQTTDEIEILSANVGIGTTSPDRLLQVSGTRPFLELSDASAGTNLKHWTMSSQGGSLYIATSSDLYATSTLAAIEVKSTGQVSFNHMQAGGAGDDDVCMNPTTRELTDANGGDCIVSSIFYKENIRSLGNAMSTIMALNPVTFTYKPELDHSVIKGVEHFGLIAEEVNLIEPRLVGFEADGLTPRTVRYEEMVALLVKAIQEQQKEIDQLKNSIGVHEVEESKPWYKFW